MKYLIRLEELIKLAAAFYFSWAIGFSPLVFILFVLVPDVSMIGYIVNSRWGAYLYNLTHHQAVGIALIAGGYIIKENHVIFAGLILVAHSSLDRTLGFGLKYEDDFKHTHLGWIGKKTQE
jgi:hypothetical protein